MESLPATALRWERLTLKSPSPYSGPKGKGWLKGTYSRTGVACGRPMEAGL